MVGVFVAFIRVVYGRTIYMSLPIFNAASIKITVFKIKSHFTKYSSVISSLIIILTEI